VRKKLILSFAVAVVLLSWAISIAARQNPAPAQPAQGEEVEARDLKVRPDHCLVWPMDIRT